MRLPAFAFLAALCAAGAAAAGEPAAPFPTPPKPEIRSLGGEKYQVGPIVVDKAAGSFAVPGKILRLDPPVEFLAVAKGGHKAYESYLELEADAFQFNIACLLAGLDANKGEPPKFHFDPAPLQGTPVEISVGWEADGETVEKPAAALLKPAGPDEWVYTGSRFSPEGRYMAEAMGTLVGLIHDPDSVIEHRAGFGQASYGNLRPDPALSPPPGAAVRLIVRKKN